MKEFSETGTKRERLADGAREQMQDYSAVRGALGDQLVALESEPTLSLTPFTGGVP